MLDVRDAVQFVRNLEDDSPQKWQRPWAILGKGPTSDFANRFDWSEYYTVTLNHACRLLGRAPVMAHFVDLEALWDCEAHLTGLQSAVCLPWHPHVGCKPHGKTLLDWAAGPGLLRDCLTGGRLLSYNATNTSLPPHPALTSVRLRFFSAVGVFNLLALAEVTEIHTLGVDGGTGYGQAFAGKDRLRNGRASFDAQTAELEKTCRCHGIRRVDLAAGLH